MKKHIAIYVRVSSKGQNTASQKKALTKWAESFDTELPIKWYKDKFTGKTMNRPGWNKLQKAIDAKKVKRLVVWKLDRLGRTAVGVLTLVNQLRKQKTPLISLTEGFDSSTPMGKMMCTMMAGFAEFENELRTERIVAGQAIAKEKGKTWGGSKKGRLCKVTERQAKAVIDMNEAGEKKVHIQEITGLTQPTIRRLIKRYDEGDLVLE